MDNLLDQIVNISKAGAYDIVVKHNQELKEENDRLKELIEALFIKYKVYQWNNKLGLFQTKSMQDWIIEEWNEYKEDNDL